MYFRIQSAADSLLGLKIGRTPVKLFESIERDVVVSAVLAREFFVKRSKALRTAHATKVSQLTTPRAQRK